MLHVLYRNNEVLYSKRCCEQTFGDKLAQPFLQDSGPVSEHAAGSAHGVCSLCLSLAPTLSTAWRGSGNGLT